MENEKETYDINELYTMFRESHLKTAAAVQGITYEELLKKLENKEEFMKYQERKLHTVRAVRYWGDEESFDRAAEFTHQTFTPEDKNEFIKRKVFPVRDGYATHKGEDVAIIGDYIVQDTEKSFGFEVYDPKHFDEKYEPAE